MRKRLSVLNLELMASASLEPTFLWGSSQSNHHVHSCAAFPWVKGTCTPICMDTQHNFPFICWVIFSPRLENVNTDLHPMNRGVQSTETLPLPHCSLRTKGSIAPIITVHPPWNGNWGTFVGTTHNQMCTWEEYTYTCCGAVGCAQTAWSPAEERFGTMVTQWVVTSTCMGQQLSAMPPGSLAPVK